MRLAKEMGYLSGKNINWVQQWALTYFLADGDRMASRQEKSKWERIKNYVDQLSIMSNPKLYFEINKQDETEEESEYIPFEDLGKLGQEFFDDIYAKINSESMMTGDSPEWSEWS